MNNLEHYAMKILVDAGCDCYTYGGEYADKILDDLKTAFPDGMEYPLVDVANAILAISRPAPIRRAPYRVHWETDDTADGYDCESFGQAKCDAEDTLINWMTEARAEWADVFHPTEDELDNYNYMICNCCVSVAKYNPGTDEYDTCWEPSYEDEEQIGWKELSIEDIEKEARS